VEFAILGPTSVRVDDEELELGGVRQRALLALLLVRRNRPVSAEVLLDEFRTPEGRASAATALRSHIGELRALLGDDRLQVVTGGYRLRVTSSELDAEVFEGEVDRAHGALARGAGAAAADVLVTALGRWRGSALADAEGAAWAAAESARLEELRLCAEELLLRARLGIAAPAELIADADAGVRAHPLRETRTATLMLALQQSGRSGDAVRAYERLRALLATELGRQPSPELTRLEHELLSGDFDHGAPPAVVPPLPRAPWGGEGPSGEGRRRTLPDGVVTFLMTDVVGSTRLWERDPRTMRDALVRHDELMAEAVAANRGVLLRERGEGDSTFSVFWRATDGAAAAIAAQLALAHEPWPPSCPIRVRMAVHTGEASEREGDYYGRPVNRVARLRAIAEGGQILVSKSTAEIVLDHLPADTSLTELGIRELKDMDRPEMVYVLIGPGAGLGPGEQEVEMQEAPREPGPRAAPVMPAAPAAVPTWQAVVSTDEAFFARSGAEGFDSPEGHVDVAFPLTAPRVLIGRRSQALGVSPDIDLSGDLEDPGVSRVHAILERQPDGSYSLIDPGSTNGTFLKDCADPIPPSVPINLRSGDCFSVGAWTRIRVSSVP